VTRRRLLGRFAIDDQIRRSIDDTALLQVWFGEARADATALSVDGNLTVAWLSPSGAVAGLLVQDYVDGENRSIAFDFGEIEIANDGSEITVFLRA
jgi:hypothetical protein